ncbi:helix-turn-helix transcriptional regulator [Amnibacterium setariae]|uniref:helix-turn-helix transcriptional regulator n=1 Tax=Amnibacterium setariae TaxID=2306585 RepID=UPI0013144534|nr:LuxR C-terminal-related transcriptional regulator [Amnibacterium setariae]
MTGSQEALVPYIGRAALLRAAGLRVEAGRGTVLTGPAGVGKSRTLQAIVELAERGGTRAERLLASKASAAVPLGAFLPLLPRDAIDEARAADPLGRAAVVRSAVLALGLELLAVDDAHLLDDASAALLHDLARAGVVVVIALDPCATGPDVLHAVPETARAETVEVPPLTQEETAEFAEAVLQGTIDAGSALTLHRASGGIPLALRELLEDQLRSGGVDRTGDLLSIREPLRAATPVDARVRAGLAGLDGDVREWVELVAVAERVPMDLAAGLVDDGAADQAEAGGWVRLDGHRQYRIAQPLHRRPVLDTVGSRARRRALQALVDAGRSLPREPTADERVLLGRWRLELGEDLARDEALQLAVLTSPSQPELRERFLRVAAADGDPTALAALAQHLVASGSLEEAERLLWRAEAAGGSEERIAALLALATGLGERRSTEALADLDRALERHPQSLDLLGVQVALLQAEARSSEAAAAAERLAALPASGAGSVLGEVYGAVAMAARGDREAATRMADDLRPLAERYVHQLPEGPMLHAWLEATVPWVTARDARIVVRVGQAGYDQTLRDGLRPDRARFAHLLAAGRLAQGDARTAVRLLREAEAVPCFWRDSQRPDIVANLVESLVLAGEADEAERTLERLRAMRRTPDQEGAVRLAEAAVLMAQGERDAAAALALETGDAAAARGERAAAADGWTAALRYGSEEAARRLQDLTDLPAGSVRALVVEHAAALLAHDPSRLTAVAEAYWAADARLLAVEAAAEAARTAIAADDTVEATAATERVLRWSVATPGLADPLAGALPLAGLTTREQEIVRLAATGLQDREIAAELGISVRTAQTHLGRAFNKLGVHRRQQLARLLPSI